MADWLPNIDIAVRENPRLFLERMGELGRRSGRFDVEPHFDALGEQGFHVVNFRYREASLHEGLGANLSVVRT